MNDGHTGAVIDADKTFFLHPFTDQREWCSPDFEPLVLVDGGGAIPNIAIFGKGLSGGYLPLAITLMTEDIFSRFDGSVAEGRALAGIEPKKGTSPGASSEPAVQVCLAK